MNTKTNLRIIKQATYTYCPYIQFITDFNNDTKENLFIDIALTDAFIIDQTNVSHKLITRLV
jgi:hypothetical protein